MFKKDSRYMTRGIQADIPLQVQLFLWNLIDESKNKGTELDYLQVFVIKSTKGINNKYLLNIEHRQEVPEYKNTTNIISDIAIDEKIFVIDDGTHSTMMLAQEY